MLQVRIYVVLICPILAFLYGCGYAIPSRHVTEEYTPVFAAADACDLPAVRNAIERDPALLSVTEWEEATLLHKSVERNCNDLATYLVDKGADVRARRSDGVTPLHIAAQRGNIEIAALLIEHGAPINAVDEEGWTPLDRAQQWDQKKAAEFLKGHGARSSNAAEWLPGRSSSPRSG